MVLRNKSGSSRNRAIKSSILAALLFGSACGDRGADETRPQTDSLLGDQLAVLGFEAPTVDWTSPSGGLSESTTASQGAKSLGTAAGWREITSAPLSSLGPVKGELSLDVRAPTLPGWGTIQVVLVAPSLQMWWTDLGSRNLSSLTAGQFTKLSFALPSAAETALEGSYSDLRIKIIINGPDLGSPYLLDNIDLVEGGGPPSPPSNVHQFSVVVPEGQTRSSMFLSASHYLQVDDRVEIALAGSVTNVAGLGAPGSQFGSDLEGHTNLFSVGNIWLRSQTVVDGFVRTEGIISEQDGTVHVSGARQPGASVPTRTFSWDVEFPSSPAPLALIPVGASVTLDPGAYQTFNQHGGEVFLRTGTYYFDSFSTEPAAAIRIDNASGPVLIYVKNGFTFKGAFTNQVRDAQLLVGHLGTTPAFLQAPFVGTIVAPNGKVELQRPTSGVHRGSFFAKELQVFSDSHILHVPFDWTTLTDDETPDTDGDGAKDPDDGCVLDANKTSALLCGCNDEETDDDQDTVPVCFDFCPEDPHNTFPGPCGCIGQDTLQPAGVSCIVEACSGSRQAAMCDGQGQCGVPDCAPDPECTTQTFRDSLYWFCDGPVGWEQAESLCNAEPGRHLVKVDDRIENLWLATVTQGESWLGGNDLVEEERWTWSRNGNRAGPLFWLNGLPVPGVFEEWQGGGALGEHCLELQDDGTWADAACAEVKGYVCEQPLRKLPPPLKPPCLCDFFPGISCDSCGEEEEPEGDCIEGDLEFGDDFEVVKSRTEACSTQCTSAADYAAGTPGCVDNCTGFAEPPVQGLSCAEYSDVERAFCDLIDVHPTETCSLQDPSCPAGFQCGRRHECAALNAEFQAQPCDSDSDCNQAAGHYCGSARSVCIDPNLDDKCDVLDGDRCVGLCFGSFACGTVEPACASNDDSQLLNRCSLTRICADPDAVVEDANPVTDPNSNLDEQAFPSDSFFPEIEETPSAFPTAKPDGCGGEGEPACDYAIGEHPWCNFQIEPGQAPGDKLISDSDPLFGDKQGTGGGSGPIRFDFDPNLGVSYTGFEALPLGDARFGASATASATASAHFDILGFGGDVSILDAAGLLGVDRCGLNADARLSVFGFDLLPVILEGATDKIEKIDTPDDVREACEETIDEIQKAVNRAQKALRDAQELIRQQKLLVERGERLRPDLCEQLLGAASKGLPADFPTPNEPFSGCGDLSPEDTINLFIRYYRRQVYSLVTEQARLLREGIPQLDPEDLKISFLDNVDDPASIDESRRETQQIVNIPFFIGPIPMNLTVEAFLQYGVAGDLTFSLTPDALVNTYDTGERAELAYIDASIAPFAGAGVTMFVGVGFDFGPFSAKLGISGDISLGLVSLPMYAGAGVGVQGIEDARSLPSDLLDKAKSAEMLFPKGPPKKYRYDAHYKFGADVDIQDILNGTISAKLRLKFAFFSKTWKKDVARISSGIDDIHINLISESGSTDFIDSWGLLGEAVRMPVPFVDLAELQTPPPLPPLPDPGTGGAGGASGGTGGTAGTAGSGGAGGEGNRPPVSLLVSGDPRYKSFDDSRVDEMFYSGYCECSDGPDACSSDLDCCGDSFCTFDDQSNQSSCVQCVAQTELPAMGQVPAGQHCERTEECCQDDPLGRDVRCYPFAASGQPYCQACRQEDEPAFDGNRDWQSDYGECCGTLTIFLPPLDGVPYAGVPVCNDCRSDGESCNVDQDCCGYSPTGSGSTCRGFACQGPVE